MAYGKINNKSGVIDRVKFKFARIIISSFPLRSIRVWGLRLCGFRIGQKVYVGSGLCLTMPNSKSECILEVGDRVSIGPRVNLLLASDANWSNLNELYVPIEGRIRLEDDCWIGAGATILPNIIVGRMSIVGAGTVVTHDVPPFTVVAGNPSKIIKTIAK